MMPTTFAVLCPTMSAMLLTLLCAAPALAQAPANDPAAPAEVTAPSTQPAGENDRRPGFERRRMDGPGGFGGFGGPGRGEGWRAPGPQFDMEEEPPAEDWEKVVAFTQQYSPKRWESFTKLPEEKRERLRRFMYWRYRQVIDLQENDPEMYDLHLKRLTIEDAIFPLAWTIRQAQGAQTKEVQDAFQEMRKHVVALVVVSLNERQARLLRMKRRLDGEEQQLSLDRTRQDEMVEHRMEEILRTRGWIGPDGRRPFVSGPEGRGGEPVGPPPPAPAPTPAAQ